MVFTDAEKRLAEPNTERGWAPVPNDVPYSIGKRILEARSRAMASPRRRKSETATAPEISALRQRLAELAI